MNVNTYQCPHCNKLNKIAGLTNPNPDSVLDTKNPIQVYCGFCGKKFLPKQSEPNPFRP